MKSLYCTGDVIGSPGGGGQVAWHELEALKGVSEVGMVLQNRDVVHPAYPAPELTFLHDYFALDRVSAFNGGFDLAHFYSGTYTMTVRWLKRKGAAVAYTAPSHNQERSIEEALLVHGAYPFPHMADEGLFELHNRCLVEADLVIAPGKASADYLASKGVRNIRVIPHGAEPPEEAPPFPDTFRAGYLGQTGADKGLRYLINAWGRLAYDGADLLLAGHGTEDLQPVIWRLADKGNFTLAGYVASPSEFYRSIAVYVQPSVTEGFGIEVLEAMGHGRPVVVSEGAGAADVVEEGVEGYVVPIRDPGAIAERLDHFRKNPHLIAEMGARARGKAMGYTWDKVRAKYQDAWGCL